MSRDSTTLLDIVRAGELIVQFINGVERSAFDQNVMLQSAVLHQLMVLGEAVTRLSAAFRDANEDVPWKLIVGMRHRLIHGYDDVDLNEVWYAATKDVPELIGRLKPLTP